MALISKLVQIGFTERQARAIGWSFGKIAAAGNSQGTATLIEHNLTFVTGADGTKGVRLPPVRATLSGFFAVYNQNVSNNLRLYPAAGECLNGGLANAFAELTPFQVALLFGSDNSFGPSGAPTWMIVVGDP